MKTILTVEATEPEDKAELKNMLRVNDILGALQEFDNYLRGRLKYEDLSGPVADALQEARDKLWAEMNCKSIDLWEC